MARSSTKLRIREASPADAARLLPLFRTFYGEWFGEDFMEEAVASRLRGVAGYETVVVAESGDRIAGFAGLRLVPSLDPAPHAEVTDLCVDADFLRHGVGTALVAHIEDLARAHGATRVTVLAGHVNKEAMAFYRRCGYEDYAVAFSKRLGR